MTDLTQAIIVDIDGTVATHYDAKGKQIREHHDYSQVGKDLPIPEIIELVQMYEDKGYTILFVTGRMGTKECRELTEEWLRSHNLPFDELWMRTDRDFREDSIVKFEIFKEHIQDQFDVKIVLDDRQRVVDMWRGQGLRVLQVDKGDF